jgi:hypothetical protein
MTIDATLDGPGPRIVPPHGIKETVVDLMDRYRDHREIKRQQRIFDKFTAMPSAGISYCPPAWHAIEHGNSQMMFFGYDKDFLEVRFQNQTYETLKRRLSKDEHGDRAYAILPPDEEAPVLTQLAEETGSVHILRAPFEINRGYSVLNSFYVLTFDPICELAPIFTDDTTPMRLSVIDFDFAHNYGARFEAARQNVIMNSTDSPYES